MPHVDRDLAAQPQTPAPSPKNTLDQELQDKALDYARAAQKLQDRFAEFHNRREALEAKWEKAQAYFEKAYDSSVNPYQEEMAVLGPKMEAEEASLRAEARALAAQLEAVGAEGAGMALHPYRGGGPRGSATVGGMATTAATLATAYFMVQDILYIIEADNAVEALSRAGEVGSKYVIGAAEYSLFNYLTSCQHGRTKLSWMPRA